MENIVYRLTAQPYCGGNNCCWKNNVYVFLFASGYCHNPSAVCVDLRHVPFVMGVSL